MRNHKFLTELAQTCESKQLESGIKAYNRGRISWERMLIEVLAAIVQENYTLRQQKKTSSEV